MTDRFREKYSLRRIGRKYAARARSFHRPRDEMRRMLARSRTTELDELIGLIDHYEERFGSTPLSLAVVTLDDTSEVRLARLLRRAIGRGRPIPRHVFDRYTEPACAVS